MASMSPSDITPITAGQCAKFSDLLAAALRKSDLPSEPTQHVLEEQGPTLVDEFVASVRKRVEAISALIRRVVPVNRNRTPQDMLDATGRKQYTDKNVVKAMPRGTGEQAEVQFFKLDLSKRGGYISDDDLDKEYELQGLKPVDPFSLGAVNEADPAFADDHPNCTHWKDANGRWCYAAFYRWGGERFVNVRRRGRGWDDYWFFGGVRK